MLVLVVQLPSDKHKVNKVSYQGSHLLGKGQPHLMEWAEQLWRSDPNMKPKAYFLTIQTVLLIKD